MANSIYEAQQAIAAILSDIEVGTGALVREVALTSVDVTQMNDPGPRWIRSVRIELWPIPGSSWEVG